MKSKFEMLSTHNLALVQRERDVPGLAVLLDPAAFADAWRAHRELPYQPAATIDYIRYKPGRRCIVMYSITAGDRRYTVVATAHNRKGWRKQVHRRDASDDTHPEIPEDLAAVWVTAAEFPCDRRLRSLQEVRTPELAEEFFRRFVDRKITQEFRYRRVAYKPARRAVYCVRSSASRRYALKFFDESSFEPSKRRMLSWHRCRRDLMKRGVDLAKLLRATSGRRITVSRWLGGENLAEAMMTGDLSDQIYRRVGGALAELHQSHPPDLTKGSGPGCSNRLLRLAEDAGFLVPHLRDALHFYAHEIQAQLNALPTVLTPIHGDFCTKQLCIRKQSIGVLDFDASVLANPLRDVGNLIAKLIWNAQRGEFTPDTADRVEAEFLRGYASRRGTVSAAELDLHIAAALFHCITSPFRSGLDDWPHHMASVLEFVGQRFDRFRCRHDRAGATRSAQLVPNAAPAAGSTPSSAIEQILQEVPTPWMANALIPQRAKERLVACCPDLRPYGPRLELERVESLRYKPGRRCLIRYDIRVGQSQAADLQFSVIGKTRFKGVDQHSFDTQTDLFKAGLNEGNSDGVAVPKPLGIDPGARTWFQEYVPGEAVEEMTTSSADRSEIPRRIASALVSLHRTDIQRPLRRYTREDELTSLCQRLRDVIAMSPHLESSINEVVLRAAKIAERLSCDQQHGIHRDFYPAQVLATPRHIYLLDFDLYCQGPMMLDAGNFVGHLRELAIRSPELAAGCQAAADAFLIAYRDLVGDTNGQLQSLEAWTWMTLARHIWIATRIPGRAERIEELISTVIQDAERLAGQRHF